MFKRSKQIMIGAILSIYCAFSFAQNPNTGVCLTSEENELTLYVNQYRVENGLLPVPVSYWVSTVGQWHVWDLVTNNPVGGSCDLHSWSNARPDLWTPVCYMAGQGAQMWNKARQISHNVYTGNVYENAASSGNIDAETAIALWKNSQPHREVILNQGIWASQTWRGMGIGIYGNYAVLWFGVTIDSTGTILPCLPVDSIFNNGFE